MDSCCLPRSIRWRLQLGVWKLPKRDTDDVKWSLAELVDYNRATLESHRRTYQELLQELHELLNPNATVQSASDTLEVAFPIKSNNHNDNDKDNEMDPLSALAKEREEHANNLWNLERKKRKERALQKRGVYHHDEGDSCTASSMFGVIEKDLLRLPQDHNTYHHSRNNFAARGDDIPFETSVKQRCEKLTEILQVYAQQHPEIGYRQGMHEVCSFLLLVIEMEIFDVESNHTEATELLDANYMMHDGYFMFEAVMSQLRPAYDVRLADQTCASPMEQMAKSILTLIRDIASDSALHQHLLNLNCPPELYTTRWIRLMFSREVSGWKNVLLLWDIFMDLISTSRSTMTSMNPSHYTRPGVSPPLKLGGFSLYVVLEATAASMILLQRNALLKDKDGNESDSIHRLMNMTPLKNIKPLSATVLSMMRRIQLRQSGRSSASVMSISTTDSSKAHRGSSVSVTDTERALRRSSISNTGAPKSARRSSVSINDIAEIAQSAISTSGQSIINIFRQEDTNTPGATVGQLSTDVDTLSSLATKLNVSLHILNDFLVQEHPSLPTSISDALMEIKSVRDQLRQTSRNSS